MFLFLSQTIITTNILSEDQMCEFVLQLSDSESLGNINAPEKKHHASLKFNSRFEIKKDVYLDLNLISLS